MGTKISGLDLGERLFRGYYAEQFRQANIKVSASATHVIGEGAAGRTITVNVTGLGGQSGVAVTYAEKK